MGSWGPFGATAGTLLGSLAGALVNTACRPGGHGVRLADPVPGRARRRARRARHPAPLRGAGAPSAARQVASGRGVPRHWRTMLHLVAAGRRAQRGLLHHLRVHRHLAEAGGGRSGADGVRDQHRGDGGVARRRLLARRTAAIGWAGGRCWSWSAGCSWRSGVSAHGADGARAIGGHPRRPGRARVLVSAAAVCCQRRWRSWRRGGCAARCCRSRTMSGVALLGGTTPLVAAWLVSGPGFTLAPAVYLAAAAAPRLRRRAPAAPHHSPQSSPRNSSRRGSGEPDHIR